VCAAGAVEEAAPRKACRLDPGGLRGCGKALAHLAGLVDLVALERLHAEGARGGERLAGAGVDELRLDAPVGAEDDEPRPLGRAREGLANTLGAPGARLPDGEPGLYARFPARN